MYVCILLSCISSCAVMPSSFCPCPPQTKTAMGEAMKEAMFSLAKANFAAGDFRYDMC